ncbi:MAG: rhomboid family intramembrane serine protease [Dehalococcoidia bacterium]|nr:rhomboid family intramembrane serine protease [Dehalococcoidia bacterium]
MIPIRDSVRSTTFPVMNYTLIAVNFLVFFYELSLGRGLDSFINHWAMTPALVTTHPLAWSSSYPPVITTVFTSMFLHGGWTHILGNMLFLWVFGDNVEDSMGSLRYLLFYVAAGVAAAAAQIFMGADSRVPSLGASGAISGILGAYLVLYPGAKVLTWVPVLIFLVIRIPAVVFIVLWFLIQFLQGLASAGEASLGGVAWWAHVGGFVAGLILVNIFRSKEKFRFTPG